MQNVNKWVWLCFNTTLFRKVDWWWHSPKNAKTFFCFPKSDCRDKPENLYAYPVAHIILLHIITYAFLWEILYLLYTGINKAEIGIPERFLFSLNKVCGGYFYQIELLFQIVNRENMKKVER
jgi:hypothetical protein